MAADGAIHADVYEWDAWRPEHVAALLAAVEVPWYVAAGWAIDLFLGGQRREHEDLEIAIPGERLQEVVDALRDLEVFVVGPEREIVRPLAQARHLLEQTHQTWVRDPREGVWRFDIFREPSDTDTWISRRDSSIRLPYDDVIARTPESVPFGRPEIVLLYKAKHSRPKDDADFAAVLPLLDGDARRWLVSSLELVHPGHRWLDELR